jgi:glycine/D-amino acid oxidase-like deaminating enzyme
VSGRGAGAQAQLAIVGQGLAGTMLGWACEQAGIAFTIFDRGHAAAASGVAAGLVNPITGRRLVKSWRVDTLLPEARATYRALEAAWGVRLWTDLRVRRFFADGRERRAFAEKHARGELSPWVTNADADGFWIESAGRVDLPVLLATARMRWRSGGRLREETFDWTKRDAGGLAIDCSGVTGALRGGFDFVPWKFARGETLELAVDGLPADIVWHRRQWIVPTGPGTALAGATHGPGVPEARPTTEARAMLEARTRELLDRPFAVRGHRAGVRVTLPDKRPVVGRHPGLPGRGVMNGLGAKGVLLAPMLARQWTAHLTAGTPFDPEVDVSRFW